METYNESPMLYVHDPYKVDDVYPLKWRSKVIEGQNVEYLITL